MNDRPLPFSRSGVGTSTMRENTVKWKRRPRKEGGSPKRGSPIKMVRGFGHGRRKRMNKKQVAALRKHTMQEGNGSATYSGTSPLFTFTIRRPQSAGCRRPLSTLPTSDPLGTPSSSVDLAQERKGVSPGYEMRE